MNSKLLSREAPGLFHAAMQNAVIDVRAYAGGESYAVLLRLLDALAACYLLEMAVAAPERTALLQVAFQQVQQLRGVLQGNEEIGPRV